MHVKTIALLLPLFVSLAACSDEPAPEPAPTQTAVVPVKPSLPAPDQASFSAMYAEACPDGEKVNQAVCKRAGMGSPEVTCEYSLGDDEYLRNEATLVASDTAWTLKDPEAICTKPTDNQAG